MAHTLAMSANVATQRQRANQGVGQLFVRGCKLEGGAYCKELLVLISRRIRRIIRPCIVGFISSV